MHDQSSNSKLSFYCNNSRDPIKSLYHQEINSRTTSTPGLLAFCMEEAPHPIQLQLPKKTRFDMYNKQSWAIANWYTPYYYLSSITLKQKESSSCVSLAVLGRFKLDSPYLLPRLWWSRWSDVWWFNFARGYLLPWRWKWRQDHQTRWVLPWPKHSFHREILSKNSQPSHSKGYVTSGCWHDPIKNQ